MAASAHAEAVLAEPFESPKYRADIDGLRAVAVLSVVAYHAFHHKIAGGFVGVDVFFVISGFLISLILIGNLQRNSFSFFEFYRRRILRIFPALILVLTACGVFGWFALLAPEYRELGKQVAAGAGFVSNFALWNESGYFDDIADLKPLLHLWSLAIEEQFYLLWPLALWMAWKWRNRFLAIVLVLAAASAALSAVEVRTDKIADFYSPATRFWELLVGAPLAYLTLKGSNLFGERWRRDVAATAGLVLLGASVLFVSRDLQFPGLWALLPTGAAFLVIAAGPDASVNRWLLAHPALVWVGLVSYPLYLWHWPILSFARILEGETPSPLLRCFAILVSLGLAWGTQRFVENPLRGRRGAAAPIVLLLGLSCIGALGYGCYVAQGFPVRADVGPVTVNRGDIGHDTFLTYYRDHFYPCNPPDIYRRAQVWQGIARCFQTHRDGPATMAIVGDSHAEQLLAGIAEALPQQNVVYYERDSLPALGNPDFKRILEHLRNDPNPRVIVFAASWDYRLSEIAKVRREDPSLTATVSSLTAAGKKVYLAEDVPVFPFDPQKCRFRRRFSSPLRCTDKREHIEEQRRRYLPVLMTAARSLPATRLLKVTDYFCQPDVCSMAHDGLLLYRDSNHLNLNGSRELGRHLVDDNPDLLRSIVGH